MKLTPNLAAFLLLVAALAAGGLVPVFVASALVMTLLTQAAISAVLATGVGILLRQNGVVSFGHAAYFGIACYTIGLALRHKVMATETAIILALVIPTALAFLLGLVIVRIPGVAFSMLTLAVGQAFHEFALKARPITGGEDGFTLAFPREIFGIATATFQRPHSAWVVSWIMLVVLLYLLHRMIKSPFGRLTAAIRENEERARFIGYETVVPRALIYALSALIAAIAGVLFILYNAFVSPETLFWVLSGEALIMCIVGGPRLLLGPALGAVVFFFFKDVMGDITVHWQGAIGITLIVVTVLLPQGLGGALVKLGARWRAGGAGG